MNARDPARSKQSLPSDRIQCISYTEMEKFRLKTEEGERKRSNTFIHFTGDLVSRLCYVVIYIEATHD